jgi:MFS family permease
MGCVALFTISSLLCGLAPSLTWLIIFRVLQGAGGEGLQPSEQSILADTFPLDKLGMVFALYQMSQLSLQMAYSDAVWMRVIQSSGLAFRNVLDSERALFASQSDLAQSEATVSTDVVALYKALGGELGGPRIGSMTLAGGRACLV